MVFVLLCRILSPGLPLVRAVSVFDQIRKGLQDGQRHGRLFKDPMHNKEFHMRSPISLEPAALPPSPADKDRTSVATTVLRNGAVAMVLALSGVCAPAALAAPVPFTWD